MITEKEIYKALSSIIDPDFQKDIVSLGFVKKIHIEGGKVSFDIELTTPACPIKEKFRQAAETNVKALDGVEEVEVTMTAQKRPSPAQHQNSGLKDVKTILAISSCKGGVGKSTISAYLAGEIARRGFKVGLLDADLFGPSIPTLFNIHNPLIQTDKDKKKYIPIEKDGLKIMSFGFLAGESPTVMRGPMVSSYIKQLLHNVAWGKLDYLLIDFPPGTGDIQLTITQSIQLDGSVIITTMQSLALADVAKGILMFEKVNVPMLGVIENMSYFVCGNCKTKHFIFGDGENTLLTDKFGLETLARFPLDPGFALKQHEPTGNELIKTATDAVIMALGKHAIKTQKPMISFDDEKITLKWPDGMVNVISNFDLRASCKCAICVDEMTGKQVLEKKDIIQGIRANEIIPLGNYAISIKWNDGHNSGIYSYKSIAGIAGKPSEMPVGS